MDLEDWSVPLKTLAEPTRVRLLSLLESQELTVAELCAITGLQQSRVSTHLAKLKDAHLVRDRRAGVSSFYRMDTEALTDANRSIWEMIRNGTRDAILDHDQSALQDLLSARAKTHQVSAVSDDLERYYTPGRTWEALARSAMQLVTPGDVLDIASGDGAFAELLAPVSRSFTCLDASEKAIDSSRARLAHLDNVELQVGDMHSLPFNDRSFDLVVMMQALNYSVDPAVALREASRVLRKNGRLLVTTLAKHPHKSAARTFDHVNLGFSTEELSSLLSDAKLKVHTCRIINRERRQPHFELIAATATKEH